MTERTTLQSLAMLVGAAFLIVGIIGFIPGLTTELYGGLDFAGHESEAEVLGLFQTSWVHNIIHLLFGVVGLALARTWDGARNYMLGGGVIYIAVWLYGWIVDNDSGANFIPTNTADQWLHAVLGIGMIVLGVALSRGEAQVRPTTA